MQGESQAVEQALGKEEEGQNQPRPRQEKAVQEKEPTEEDQRRTRPLPAWQQLGYTSDP